MSSPNYRQRFLAAGRLVGAVAGLVFFVATPVAADTTVRLVAADRADKPLVSDLVAMRRSPYGGLIATQWVSSVRLDADFVFPTRSLGFDAPLAPGGDGDLDFSTQRDDILTDGLDELDDELRADVEKPRLVDAVDPIYIDQEITGVKRIGPSRARRSEARVDVKGAAVLRPGGPLRPAGDVASVLCYPVTITAAAADDPRRRLSFSPRLAYAGADLLADCLFEYSPTMPLGDTELFSGLLSDAEKLALQRGTANGQRQFRRLTMYLPATDDKPYELDGLAFHVAAGGVRLVDPGATNDRGVSLRLAADEPFHVQLARPLSASSDAIGLPVMRDLPAVFQTSLDGRDVLDLSAGEKRIAVTVKRAGGRGTDLWVSFPDIGVGRPFAHGLLQLVGEEADKLPTVRLIALPPLGRTRDGALAIHVATGASGAAAVEPTSFAGTLFPRHGYDPEAAGPEPVAALDFKRTAAAGAPLWEADVATVPVGAYWLRLRLEPRSDALMPVVVADSSTVGSVTLSTHHNRSDYLRGEQIRATILLRSLDRPVAIQAVPRLVAENGEVIDLDPLDLDCDAASRRSTFLTLPTRGLRLGGYRLELVADGLISYPLAFTLYPEQAESTFSIFRWSPSFCGPIKAAGEPIVNGVLGSSLATSLSPTEMAELTAQDVVPRRFAAWLRNDPLLPAESLTAVYDPETEAEMAASMRLGIRYAPNYGWGLAGQESDWNPKHTLPEDLERVHRLALQVTQRHRDFGNFAGLYLNWFPTIRGYWEDHPAVDGHRARRGARLGEEIGKVWGKLDVKLEAKRLPEMDPDDPLYRSADAEAIRDAKVRVQQYRTASLPRAYEAWTRGSRALRPGAGIADLVPPSWSAAHDDPQAGLLPHRPVYLSSPAVGWWPQTTYYPPVYFSTLPVAGVHGYTDYGFCPFNPVWAIDYYAGGLGAKPVWVTSMSYGGSVLVRHVLMSVARGADGVSFKDEGHDPTTWQVLSAFLKRHGPALRTYRPHSDVGILASYRQQVAEGLLANKWMGYNGGPYFALYTQLWYARHPPAMLTDTEITLENLKRLKALFLVNQRVPLDAASMDALQAFVDQGGTIFKDEKTASYYPGTTYSLEPDPEASKWGGGTYKNTADGHFVAAMAGYEKVAKPLHELLDRLSPPRAMTDSHYTQLAAMDGEDTFALFAVNVTPPPPGIYHPTWNFWHKRVMAATATIDFDKPYVLYDLFDGGSAVRPVRRADGRFEHTLDFNRFAGRAFIAMENPIDHLELQAPAASGGGWIPVAATVVAADGRVLNDALPCEISLIDESGRTVETLYRALGPDRREAVRLPAHAAAGTWRLRVRELVSGAVAEAEIEKSAVAPPPLAPTPVAMPRPTDLAAFFTPRAPGIMRLGTAEEARRDVRVQVNLDNVETNPAPRKFVILLDPLQLAAAPGGTDNVTALAGRLEQAMREAGLDVATRVLDADAVVDLPQRWRVPAVEQALVSEARAGKRILHARSLTTKVVPLSRNAVDYLHPESGYGEPGARHRIFSDVVLLGMPGRNRLLRDLHRTVGIQATNGVPAAGSALVQVIYDGFVANRNVLTIQGPDAAGLARGVERVIAALAAGRPAPIAEAPAPTLATRVGTGRDALANPIADRLGRLVDVYAHFKNGDLLIGAGFDENNYLLLDRDGELKKKWLGVYGLHVSTAQNVFWTRHWWGDYDYVNYLICMAPDLATRWMMPVDRYGAKVRGWRYPGSQFLLAPTNDDIFVGGAHRASRVDPAGKTLWVYDDLDSCQDVYSFRFPRDVMLHDVSDDGRYLLAGVFGIEPYGPYVSKFVKPVALLLDARTGRPVWEKAGFLIDHSACAFTGDRIVLADATANRKRVALFDLQGRETWSMRRPQGTSSATLSRDGDFLIVQPEAERDRLFATVAPPDGLQSIRLADKSTRDFPLDDRIHGWTYQRDGDRLLVSLVNGRLLCFRPDTSLLWERTLSTPCKPSVAPDGKTIVAGTPTGRLLWLGENGEELKTVDLMAHNMVRDSAAYVKDYTRSPAGTPVMSPDAELAAPINVRCGKAVTFSANRLGAAAGAKGEVVALGGERTFPLKQKAGTTYVLSVFQRSGRGGAIRVAVTDVKSGASVYRADLPCSPAWAERTLAWKGAGNGPVQLRLTYEAEGGEGGAADIRDLAVFDLAYPSRNVLRQKSADETAGGSLGMGLKDLEAGDLEEEFADLGMAIEPPALSYYLPNDVDLRAKSAGAKPFKPVVWPDLPFDGKIVGDDKTSWLGKPVKNRCTHATLTLTFKLPAVLSSLAVYEDTSAGAERYTDTYAIFFHDKKTGQWRRAGQVIGNRNPFNLFTFEAATVDEITFLWLRSADDHARVAEFEGYGTDDELF